MICTPQRENGSQVAGAARKPQPGNLFRHAQPWRFARPDDGRKYRVVRERLRRLARCLAGKHFDRSGDCREIFPAVNTILKRLTAAELNYPEGLRFTWSRPTVFRYMDRLERSGIATSRGLSHYHGTRRRELHSDKLLSVPLESETPTPGQSETPRHRECESRSKSLKTWKIHKASKLAKSSKRNHDDDPCGSFSESRIDVNDSGNPAGKNLQGTAEAARLARLKAEAMAEIRTSESGDMVDAVLDLVLQRAAAAGTIIRSRRYLVESFQNYLVTEEARIAELPPPEVTDPQSIGGRYLQQHPALKIRFVHVIVEEAARRGVRASEVLGQALEDGLHQEACPGRATSP